MLGDRETRYKEAAIAALSRAEAADVALGAGSDMMLGMGSAPSGPERDRIEARRSLAWGRAEARAMRMAALRARAAPLLRNE